MADAGLGLRALRLRHPEADRLRTALSAIGLSGVSVDTGPAGLQADLTRDGQPSVSLTHTDTP